MRTYHKYGECKEGLHNKYYEVEAIEQEDGTATWAFRWARIGSECGKPKEGVAPYFAEAKHQCEIQWRKKCGKYREVTAVEALASAAQELDERPVDGLERVKIEPPCFHAGTSEKRLQAFCRKYLAKLNVVRASKNSLGFGDYEKQIARILNQYSAEYQRIVDTKAHGHLKHSQPARESFRAFFQLIREHADVNTYVRSDGVAYC